MANKAKDWKVVNLQEWWNALLPESQTEVKDWGSPDAKLVLIGETPGKTEIKKLQPFRGRSGMLLEKWWTELGFVREHFYITNVYPFFPPGGDIKNVHPEILRAWEANLHERLKLINDPIIIIPTGSVALKALTGIVRRSAKGDDGGAVTKFRGSMLSYQDRNGRSIKVIPTIHPAATLRFQDYEKRSIKDWQRIKKELCRREVVTPIRKFVTAPTIQAIDQFYQWCASQDQNQLELSADIETYKGEISCISFAPSWNYAICIPFGKKRVVCEESKVRKKKTEEDKKYEAELFRRRIVAAYDIILEGWGEHEEGNTHAAIPKRLHKAVHKFVNEQKISPALKKAVEAIEKEFIDKCEENGVDYKKEYPHIHEVEKLADGRTFRTVGYWETEDENEKAKQFVRALLALPCNKIGQNFFYDRYWLLKLFSMPVAGRIFDTQALHHCLDAQDKHSLEYMASIDTDQPYWKDEAKEPGEVEKYATNAEALWHYCCLDSSVTWELKYKYWHEIQRRGLSEFYTTHYENMMEPLFDMTCHGIEVDKEAREDLFRVNQERIKELAKMIFDKTGRRLFAVKKISPKALADYLYNDLKLPVQFKRRPGQKSTPTADEIAVRKAMLNHPQLIGEVGEWVLECNKLAKQCDFLNPAQLDEDGRMRSIYKFITEAGRLASAKNPMGTGMNAQNQDRKLRYLYLPDRSL